jgi:Xaa-Pro aminopeptidase
MSRSEGYRVTRDAMREHYPRFSEAEYQRRYGLLRGLIDAQGFDCLLFYGDSGCGFMNQLSAHWVSNYIDELHTYVVFPREGEPTAWCSVPADQPAAMACSVIEDVRAGGIGRAMARNVAARLADELRLDGKRIGLVDTFSIAPGLPKDAYDILTSAVPRAEIVDVTKEFEALRATPSDEEMEWFRRGVELTDLACDAMVEAVEPGRTEAEVWAAVHSAYLQAGGGFCFAIVGSTPMAKPVMSYPHGIASFGSTRRIERGDVVIAEVSGSYYGYSGQCFCAVALGEPPEPLLRMHRFARELHADLCRAVQPGHGEAEVLEVAARIGERGLDIESPLVHAWGTHFGAPVMGLENWGDGPFAFVDGQLVVIQPNPCTPDKLMGIQAGNMTQVRPGGAQPLHRYGTELIVK